MDDQIAYKAEDLVSSIRANTTYENYEIVIASTRDLPFQEKEVKVCNVGDSLNKAQKLNAARRSASGKILIFITDCVEIVTPSFVDELVGIASLDSVGAVCGKALYPDETIKHAGIYLGEMPYRLFSNLPNRGLSYHGYLETSKEVSALSVDFMTIKANQFDELEGFDERFPSFCDVDLCLKLRKINKHIVYNPTSEIISLETSQSCFDYTSNLRAEGHIEWSNLQAKWGDFLTHDPHVFKPASKDWRGGYLYPLLV